MPSATRNTNTNSGNEVSAPAQPKTWSNTSALIPSAAPKDSTTVAISTSGATSARSSNARITNTTASTIGMITFRSRVEARWMSRLIALPPPTLASAPGTACTAARTRSTVAYAAAESAGSVRVPSTYARSPFTTGSVTSVTPSLPASAARTCAAACALPITTTGDPAPAGKCRASTCSPRTESTTLVNDCALVRPCAFRSVIPRASPPSTSAVTTQTTRGRRAMPPPTRAHRPVAVGSAEPYRGLTGQKIHRPHSTRMTSSSATTTMIGPYSSTPSMPLNAFAESPAYPSGPVIATLSPPESAVEMARMWSTAPLALFHPSVPRLTGTSTCSACPSLAGIGPTTLVTPSSSASFPTSPPTLAQSAAVSPDGRSYTTTAGKTSFGWNSPCRLNTWVDSAETGNHAEESFFSAPWSLPASGAAANSATSQKTSTAYLDLCPAGSPAMRRTVLIEVPSHTMYRKRPGHDVSRAGGTSSYIVFSEIAVTERKHAEQPRHGSGHRVPCRGEIPPRVGDRRVRGQPLPDGAGERQVQRGADVDLGDAVPDRPPQLAVGHPRAAVQDQRDRYGGVQPNDEILVELGGAGGHRVRAAHRDGQRVHSRRGDEVQGLGRVGARLRGVRAGGAACRAARDAARGATSRAACSAARGAAGFAACSAACSAAWSAASSAASRAASRADRGAAGLAADLPQLGLQPQAVRVRPTGGRPSRGHVPRVRQPGRVEHRRAEARVRGLVQQRLVLDVVQVQRHPRGGPLGHRRGGAGDRTQSAAVETDAVVADLQHHRQPGRLGAGHDGLRVLERDHVERTEPAARPDEGADRYQRHRSGLLDRHRGEVGPVPRGIHRAGHRGGHRRRGQRHRVGEHLRPRLAVRQPAGQPGGERVPGAGGVAAHPLRRPRPPGAVRGDQQRAVLAQRDCGGHAELAAGGRHVVRLVPEQPGQLLQVRRDQRRTGPDAVAQRVAVGVQQHRRRGAGDQRGVRGDGEDHASTSSTARSSSSTSRSAP